MANWSLLVAATLLFFCGVVHSWLGEIRLIGPLLAPETRSGPLARSEFSRRVLRFAWHVTSIAWWGTGAILAAIALAPPADIQRPILIATAVTYIVTGILVLICGRGRHLAWPIFLAVGALCLAPLI